MLLSLCSASSFAADKWCSAKGRDLWRFTWVANGATEPNVGSILVKDATGKTIQVLKNVGNYREDENAVGVHDFNNDGCGDLIITTDIAGIGNESNEVFLYQRATRRFVAHEALSGIGGVYIDTEDKNCVLGSWKNGAEHVYTSRHCWRKGKLELKSEYEVKPLINGAGELKCYKETKTSYRGGRKSVRTSCTDKL